MDSQKTYSTPQAQALGKALEKRTIRVKLEHWDGYKHVDIHIPDVNINIEIDGLQHITDSKQILADLKRGYYSDIHNLYTLHINNEVLMKYLDQITDAIVGAVMLLKLERLAKLKT